VSNTRQAVDRLARLPEIARGACRRKVAERFSIETMVTAYEHVYREIFEREALKQP
jgi:glycosyltransferase involved in cell wall biosynthesis